MKKVKVCAIVMSFVLSFQAANVNVVMAADYSEEQQEQKKNLLEVSETTGGCVSKNLSAHDYILWAKTTKSYLTITQENQIQRVEAVGDKLFIERYDEDKNLVDEKEMALELPKFGGFFEGSDAYYVVCGQQNKEESDTKEVIRVIKYDKGWNRVAAVSIKGINTTDPFDAGTVAMTETQGMLYLHTCHKMYRSWDGRNHQANMSFAIDESEMKVKQQASRVWNIRGGYVSHSFNQFIETDGTNIYRLDHGDAYPRSVVLTKGDKKAISNNISYVNLLSIEGKVGDNYTGVAVGGMVRNGKKLMIVGNSKNQQKENASGVRNIFLMISDTDLKEKIQKNLTKYEEKDGIGVGNPYVVKIDEDYVAVLWEEEDTKKAKTHVCLAVVDAEGVVQGKIRTLNATLSDCKPIVSEHKTLLWYVTKNTAPIFYQVNLEELSQEEQQTQTSIKECEWKVKKDTFIYNGTQQVPQIELSYQGQTLVENEHYVCTIDGGILAGNGVVTITGIGSFSGEIEVPFTVQPADLQDAQITLEKNSYIANQKENRPDVAVIYQGTELEKDTDFTVSYENNIEEGTAYAIVTGIGNYCGIRKMAFRILPSTEPTMPEEKPTMPEEKPTMPEEEPSEKPEVVRYNLKDAILKNLKDMVYKGRPVTQKELQVVIDGKVLSPEKDYSIAYKSNENVGTATIIITGEGNNYGTLTAHFKIKIKKNQIFNGKNGTKYKVTKTGKNGTVTVIGTKKEKTDGSFRSVRIVDCVILGGVSYKVTSVSDKAFMGYTKIMQVIIGKNVENIGENAFAECKGLNRVTIGKNVKTISNSAFKGDAKLKSVTVLSKQLKTIGKHAFQNINKRAEFKVPVSKKKLYIKLLKTKTGFLQKTMKVVR